MAKRGLIAPLRWQQQVEELLAAIPLGALQKELGVVELGRRFRQSNHDRVVHPLTLAGFDNRAIRTRVFALKTGHAILPHAHNRRLSAFFVLDGSFHGRHFDRVADEAAAIWIRPTIDRLFYPGTASTISDDRDNIHWFTARAPQALLLNISLDVDTHAPGPGGRVYLDPRAGEHANGMIRAPIVSRRQLQTRYEPT